MTHPADDIHPQLFREAINHPEPVEKKTESSRVIDIEADHADLYPSVVREIENKGTEQEREALHRLESRQQGFCSSCGHCNE